MGNFWGWGTGSGGGGQVSVVWSGHAYADSFSTDTSDVTHLHRRAMRADNIAEEQWNSTGNLSDDQSVLHIIRLIFGCKETCTAVNNHRHAHYEPCLLFLALLALTWPRS